MAGIQEDRYLKISLRNFLSLHLSTLILVLLGLIILYFLGFDKYFVQVFLVVWSLDLIPAIYLHLTYLIQNGGEEYEVRDDGLIRRKKGKEMVYKSDEIERIVFYLSPALYRNSNFHFLAIEGYHYAKVKLKGGGELILTCLLAPRIDNSLMQIKGVIFQKRKRLFCTL